MRLSPSLRCRLGLHRAEPHGVVVDPRGHLACVAASTVDAVEVVDARLGRVVARRGPAAQRLAVTAAGDRLYATPFLTGEVSVVDPASRAALQVIAQGPAAPRRPGPEPARGAGRPHPRRPPRPHLAPESPGDPRPGGVPALAMRGSEGHPLTRKESP